VGVFEKTLQENNETRKTWVFWSGDSRTIPASNCKILPTNKRLILTYKYFIEHLVISKVKPWSWEWRAHARIQLGLERRRWTRTGPWNPLWFGLRSGTALAPISFTGEENKRLTRDLQADWARTSAHAQRNKGRGRIWEGPGTHTERERPKPDVLPRLETKIGVKTWRQLKNASRPNGLWTETRVGTPAAGRNESDDWNTVREGSQMENGRENPNGLAQPNTKRKSLGNSPATKIDQKLQRCQGPSADKREKWKSTRKNEDLHGLRIEQKWIKPWPQKLENFLYKTEQNSHITDLPSLSHMIIEIKIYDKKIHFARVLFICPNKRLNDYYAPRS
jgi:hypothetical protein